MNFPFMFLGVLASFQVVLSQSGPYRQCGGNLWTGDTTCVSGYICVYENDWWSECLPHPATPSGAAVTSTA